MLSFCLWFGTAAQHPRNVSLSFDQSKTLGCDDALLSREGVETDAKLLRPSCLHECSLRRLFDLLLSLVKPTHLGADLDTTLALDELHGFLVGLW